MDYTQEEADALSVFVKLTGMLLHPFCTFKRMKENDKMDSKIVSNETKFQ